MTTTTTRPATVGLSARDVLDLTLSMPDVALSAVELGGRFLPGGDQSARWAQAADLDVLAASENDARILAARWGLTEHPRDIRPATTSAGEFVHRRWTATLPTLDGLVTVRVRSCRHLLPTPAAITAAA